MPVLSVVGAPGVGKSLLVKQLATRALCPAFFEGEEGTIPAEILEKVFSDPDPVHRFSYFVDRYITNLTRAHQISELGLTVYVDGGVLSMEAMLRYEDQGYRSALEDVVARARGLESHLTVLLVSQEEVLATRIKNRGRSTEGHDAAIARSVAIQNRFQEVASEKQHVITIDCTHLSFFSESDLATVDEQIRMAL